MPCRSGHPDRGALLPHRFILTGSALECARTFRRLKGHKDMPKLVAALRARDAEIAGAKVAEVARKADWVDASGRVLWEERDIILAPHQAN